MEGKKTGTEWLKNAATHFFVDGLSGMATGLFATLIVGTILAQIAGVIPGTLGTMLLVIAKVAQTLTGAGIGCGVACRFHASPLVVLSAAVSGMVGAYASRALAGTLIVDSTMVFSGPGEPLGAFLAAYVSLMLGKQISGKTKLDILLTPLISISAGSAVGLLIGPPVSGFMTQLGLLIKLATEQQPFLMGILVSVLMGMILTLPISSAALGVILGLSGLEAGAATVGCCVNMIGFAVISFRDNGWGGLLAQGVGTSMLQIPNIVKKPVIWLPVIVTSAILGPISTMLLHMTNNAVGSGMGTAGLVGPLNTFAVMCETEEPVVVLLKILLLYFVLPAVLCLLGSEWMRKKGWIQSGDMKLEV